MNAGRAALALPNSVRSHTWNKKKEGPLGVSRAGNKGQELTELTSLQRRGRPGGLEWKLQAAAVPRDRRHSVVMSVWKESGQEGERRGS